LRLGHHFFRPEYAQTAVLFFVDRPILAVLGESGEEEAVDSLVSAVLTRSRLLEPRDIFAPLRQATAKWKVAGADGPPPCLAALALAVLAASEMRHERDRSANNYHAWFHELVARRAGDIDGGDLGHAYRESYPSLWRVLEWWLDVKHEGRLGRSTISEGKVNTNKIGFADSQTIFLSSDREKLSQFFRWIRLRPGDEIPDQELLEYFRIWASARDDLTPGAGEMITEADLSQRQLGHLIADAAAGWEGEVRDDEGRAESRLALTLSRPPTSRLGVVAPCPPGFPPSLEVNVGGKVQALEVEDLESPLAADEHRWYSGLELPVDGRLLEVGAKLGVGDRILRFAPRNLYILHMSRELGCWSSVEQIRPGEPAYLLVRAVGLPPLGEFLDRRARPDWSRVESEGVAPQGWELLRDVIVGASTAGAEPPFERLQPRQSNRFALIGGLPLRRGGGVYLTEGDPDVVLPGSLEEEVRISVELDDQPLVVEVGASVVSLVQTMPSEGSHTVRIGGATRRYSTVRTLGSIAPPTETAIGHDLRERDGGPVPLTLDAAAAPGVPEDGLRIRGALVEWGEVMQQPNPTQLILPRAASRLILISAEPAFVEEVAVPAEPPWMREAGLNCQFFEHSPAIPAAWLITWSRLRGVTARRVSTSVATTAPEDVETWCRVVAECGGEAAEPVDQAAWTELESLARAER
jgi:hypothetical protein